MGANSPAGLSSRPVRIVVADEVDRYEASAGTEGDPVTLAIKRTTNFWNRKIVLASTPGTKGISRIERAYEGSDQRHFHVPCLDCGTEQVLKWAQVVWSKEEDEATGNGQHQHQQSRHKPDAGHRHKPETAHYACGACGSLWDDGQRWAAVRRGRWVADAPFTGTAGFHLNELYSPWRRLAETVTDFLAAKDAPELLKAWTNTALGETWEERAGKLDATGLIARGEIYDEDSVPDAVRLVTAGIDVQGDRLEASRWGWGEAEEAWLIEHRIIHGDPARLDVWHELDAWLRQDCRSEAGATLRTRAAAIDMGGHHTQAVLKFCRDRRGRKVFAVKGMAGARAIWTPQASKSKLGKLSFYAVGVDTAKDTIYARLQITRRDAGTGAVAGGTTGTAGDCRKEQPSTPGYVHLPMTVTASFVAQLVAEVVQVRHHKGKPMREWVLPSGARNEALDCAVYALAARESFGKHLPGRRYVASASSRREGKDAVVGTVKELRTAHLNEQSGELPGTSQSAPAPKPLKRVMRHRWAAYR